MKRLLLPGFALLLHGALAAAGEPAGGKPVSLKASDGTNLAVSYYSSGDADTAFAYLRAQPGVRGDALGAGGASCGVNQSIQLARRHPEVKSLALLSGFTNRDGRLFLRSAKKLPLLLAASDDDDGTVQGMAWLD